MPIIGLITEGLKSKASWIVIGIALVTLLIMAIILEKKDNTILKKDNQIVTQAADQATQSAKVVTQDQQLKEQVNATAIQEKDSSATTFAEIKRQANAQLADALKSPAPAESVVPAVSESSTKAPTPEAPVKPQVIYQPSPEQVAKSQKVATIVIDTMWQSYCAAGGKCP